MSELDPLCELLQARTGLHFSPEKHYLLQLRLKNRLISCHCQDYGAYATYLSRLPTHDPEWGEVIDQVTTRETYFYRDPLQLTQVRDAILATLPRRGPADPWRLVSAACSSGEEAYTLAILAQEVSASQTCQVQGFDISPSALALARGGVYGEYAIRNLPQDLRMRYLQATPSGEQSVVPALRAMTRFFAGNLLDASTLRTAAGADLLLCRNVLIYFEAAERQRILQNLAGLLRPGGYLLTGVAETPQDIPGLTATSQKGLRFFRKGGPL